MITRKESEYFLKWNEFIETLTLDWLIENFVFSRRRYSRTIGLVEINTFALVFEIHWEDNVYIFRSPTSSHIGLTLWEDENLSRSLSSDVLDDFIRIVEL